MKRMRRILAAVICLVMVASFVPMASAATVSEGMCGDNVSWTLDDNGVLTISGTGPMSDTLVLSEEESDRELADEFVGEVFSVVSEAFLEEEDLDWTDEEYLGEYSGGYFEEYYEENMAQEWNEYMSPWAESGVTSIVIEEGVTSIGKYAFWGCDVESVTIADSVTTIGDGAFFACPSLTSVTIPASVTSIGESAFMMTSLASITIPNSVTSLGAEAFAFCTELTNVTIPASVTSIEEGVFCYCTSLTSVEIPNSVKSIGLSAFLFCTELTNVTIPDSVTSIGADAFSFCTELTSVTLPDSVTSIGTDAFNYCVAIESLKLPTRAPWQISFLVFDGAGIGSDIDYGGSDDDIAVVVEDSLLIPDSAPYIKDGRTLVPMRAIFEALGCSVEWNNEERSVTAVSEYGDEIKMAIGDNVMYVNGAAVTLDVAAEITNDRTFVPVRAISEALGCEVEWDNDTRVVYITEETAEEE